MHPLLRAFLVSLVLALLMGACSPGAEPEGPRIERVEDLVAALGKAGVEVVETAMMPSAPSLPHGRVVFLGDERVEMYESESNASESDVQQAVTEWPAESHPNVWARGRVIVVYDGLDGATIALLSGLLGDELSPASLGPVEPYPPAVASAIGWMARTFVVEPGLVVVESYEAAEWPDACLGLPGPGEACAGVLTPGWRVVLTLRDQTISLRTDDLGLQIREEPSTD
jgi:hypothetical protein